MKRLVYLLVAVSLMLALMPAAAFADEITVLLKAGQTEDIGHVKVWNDADTLYVQFVSTGDCLLETHVHVTADPWDQDSNDNDPGFPLTRKGNPIPGQFEYSDPHGCVNDYTYEIPLTWGVGTELYIAAHAALGLAETMTIFSDTSTDVTEVNGTPVTANAVLANEPVGYPNCTSYAPDGTGSAWDSAVNISGAHWIWNTLDPERPILGDVVTFNKTFTVPGLPNGGTLYITADNGYEAMLNGVLLGSAQLGPGFPTTLKETTDTTPQAGNWGVASQGWQSVESYSLTELVSGENTLVIIAANEYMWNTTDQYQGKDYYYGSWDPPGGSTNADPFPGYGIGVDNICRNPGGLIFKATMDYYASGVTAWGAGTRFSEDKNWATYFNYTVQPPPVICADFSGLDEGASVEGLGTVAPDLEIDTPTGGAVKIAEGGTTSVYGAPNLACGYTPIVNGCIVADGGFSDKTAQGAKEAHAYTFTFAPDVAVNDFSLHMLDFGDYNPSKATDHYASMTAYDAGNEVVSTHVLAYHSDGKVNPRWSDLYGDLLCGTGDACDANPGEPGNWTWSVYGSGIVRVELFFGDGYDPYIGFDTLCFVLQ